MLFRKKYAKGWIIPGGCNYYLAVANGNSIFGMIGLVKPDYGNFDLILKADTTNGNPGSVDLLLFALRSKEVKEAIERKFNRVCETAISKCFSLYPVISRYRKHAELIIKKVVRTNKESEKEDLKIKSNRAVAQALKSGMLQKQPCEVCNITDYVEAHHKDYSKPLEINWLCIKHHNERDGIDETCYKILGYDLTYQFKLGDIPSLKAAKALWLQKIK
jgi:hypothetical protein